MLGRAPGGGGQIVKHYDNRFDPAVANAVSDVLRPRNFVTKIPTYDRVMGSPTSDTMLGGPAAGVDP